MGMNSSTAIEKRQKENRATENDKRKKEWNEKNECEHAFSGFKIKFTKKNL